MPSGSIIVMSPPSVAAPCPAPIAQRTLGPQPPRPKRPADPHRFLRAGGLGRGLRLQRALRPHIEGVHRCAATDEQAVSERPAKAQIGAGLRQVDLAEQIARRAVAAHAILLRIGPAHAAPDIAIHVAAHAIGYAGCKAIGEDLAVGQLAGLDVTVEYPDVRGAPVGETGVDDVQLFLVGREAEAVWLREVIDHRLDLAGLAVDPEDIVLVLLLGLF